MVLTKIHVLPICIFILIPSSFIITYCIAVYLKHVSFEFPYISDTGTYVPESCIFSQAVNLIAFLMAAFIYVRYKHVEQHYRDHLSSDYSVVLKLNQTALIVGWMGCFGASIIANFQETSVIIVHMSGALLAFGCSAIYSWLQTVISHYVCPFLNSTFVARLRVFLSLILTASFVTTLVAGVIARKNFHGKDATKWHPEDGGFRAHIISTAAEWIVVISFDCFILTFAKEMQKISISSPQVLFCSNDVILESTEFYNSQEHVNITPNPNSLRISSLPSSPYGDYKKDNILTTQAVVH
ncbi:DNA damage-regulated autophagy modulator protein 2 [Parasteatoda tepidariorum]|uniref:DNA damage-regulated autophagy modulator protein 2 n=1 Tax=Parasteatoda tepidariorum TaxID=114398 RepID=A0A2L2YL34_PARTP|nr:DNA damage-regulated autophagy modulator protein 2 [Parasteatoda tepidariorum]XP_015912325.1 DNA damage-regulated autophagy modulator protein 2 [Parasteatoda tepidariorum]